MTTIPFSEFTELEERIVISALKNYVEQMPPDAKIFDAVVHLLSEMEYHFASRDLVLTRGRKTDRNKIGK